MYGVFQRLNCYEQNLQGLELWTQESSYYRSPAGQSKPDKCSYPDLVGCHQKPSDFVCCDFWPLF